LAILSQVVLVGLVCGLLNGILVTYGRLQPLLATLGTLSVFQGIAIFVLPTPGGYFPTTFSDVLSNGDRPISLIYVAALVMFWIVFRRTRPGVDIISVGNDASHAQANGIFVTRAKIISYLLSGVFSSIAGLFLSASSSGGDATAGNIFTLTSIVAAVMGGVSLYGGRGSPIGAIMGAFVSNMIVHVLFFSKIDPLYQNFYEGLFLIGAVVLSQMSGRLMRARA
jgi:ribose transport system permease protein